MAQIAKMEVEVEIKSSGDRFYEMFRSKQHLFPKACPYVMKDVKVIKGDWESVGSIKEWSLHVAGDIETCKETVEAIDEKNKAITFNLLDGMLMKYYKTIKSRVQVVGRLVKWTVEYEKRNDNIPPPTKYSEMLNILTKSIDAYLTRTA